MKGSGDPSREAFILFNNMENRYLRHSSAQALDVNGLNKYADEGYMLAGFTYNCDEHCYDYIFAKQGILQINDVPEALKNESGKFIMLDGDNQPTSTPKRFMFKNALMGLGVSAQVADDWIKVRKVKKAAQTETAFKIIEKQIKIGMEDYGVTANDIIRVAVDRNWQGFNSAWLENIDWSFYGIQVGKNDLPFGDNNKWE